MAIMRYAVHDSEQVGEVAKSGASGGVSAGDVIGGLAGLGLSVWAGYEIGTRINDAFQLQNTLGRATLDGVTMALIARVGVPLGRLAGITSGALVGVGSGAGAGLAANKLQKLGEVYDWIQFRSQDQRLARAAVFSLRGIEFPDRYLLRVAEPSFSPLISNTIDVYTVTDGPGTHKAILEQGYDSHDMGEFTVPEGRVYATMRMPHTHDMSTTYIFSRKDRRLQLEGRIRHTIKYKAPQ